MIQFTATADGRRLAIDQLVAIRDAGGQPA
jgi:hypothetical protein